MSKKGDYIVIRNKYLANGIQWVTGLRYFVFDNSDKKSFSFPNTKEVHQAIKDLKESKNKNNKVGDY